MSQNPSVVEPKITGDTDESEPLLPDRGRLTRVWEARGVSTAVSIVLVLGVWELVTQTLLTDSLFIVPFSAIALALYDWFASGVIWYHLYVSGVELAGAFALAAAVGIAVGVLMGFSKSIYSLLNPWVALLYATPLVVVTPFFILLFGVGITSKVALAFTVAVFPIIVNTAAGFRASEEKFVELARSFGASHKQMVTKILFPSAVPFILSGLRLGSGRAITGVVVGEFFISRAGVGYLIAQAAQTFRIPRMFAGVLLFSFSGLALFTFFDWLERRLTPWRDEVEGS